MFHLELLENVNSVQFFSVTAAANLDKLGVPKNVPRFVHNLPFPTLTDKVKITFYLSDIDLISHNYCNLWRVVSKGAGWKLSPKVMAKVDSVLHDYEAWSEYEHMMRAEQTKVEVTVHNRVKFVFYEEAKLVERLIAFAERFKTTS